MHAITFFIFVSLGCAVAACIVRRVVAGPRSLLINSAMAAALSAYLSANYGPEKGPGLAAVLVCAVASAGIVCCDWWLHRRRLQKAVENAEAVKAFGLSQFDILDHDGDGLVSGVDLYHVSADRRFTGEEKKMLERIVADLALIGHWAPIHPHETMLTQVIDNPSHVVTREEFQTYPQRAKQHFDEMFGAAGK